MSEQAIIKPQPAQEKFLRSSADIAILGGGAGGGKTWSLLMEPLRHIRNPGFGAVIFRSTVPQIIGEGGLWDKSQEIYPLVGGTPYYGNPKQWVFQSGAKITFSHMQHEKDKHNWDGQQIPLIEWDELQLFSESQFWYMFSRNRSTCGVRPYIRGSCNPDADSWLAKLVEWWIDQDTGYAIPERSGVLRWFIRVDGQLVWAASSEELRSKHPLHPPQSMTFVAAKLDDNPLLEAKDKDYRAKLMSLPLVERERLLGGNWKIRPAAGLKFPRDKWAFLKAAPPGLRLIRFWDKAYTAGGSGARTAGVLMGELSGGFKHGLPQYYVVNAVIGRWGDAEREANIRSTAELDEATYGQVTIGVEEEGGAGRQAAHETLRNLSGFACYSERPTAKKHLRWGPFAAQQQIKNVAIVCGSWDWAEYVRELDALAGDEALDKGKLKDLADASAAGFKYLTSSVGRIDRELLCSGDPDEDDRSRLTDQELAEAPDFLRELLTEYRQDQGGGRRLSAYGDD